MTKLSDLLGTRTIPISVLGHDLEVTYRLGERTPSANKDIDPFESVVATMVRLVESWDLQGDDGRPVPITEEALDGVPVPVLRRICQEIFADGGGDVLLGEASSNSNAG
jgi:hypothetical protein